MQRTESLNILRLPFCHRLDMFRKSKHDGTGFILIFSIFSILHPSNLILAWWPATPTAGRLCVFFFPPSSSSSPRSSPAAQKAHRGGHPYETGNVCLTIADVSQNRRHLTDVENRTGHRMNEKNHKSLRTSWNLISSVARTGLHPSTPHLAAQKRYLVFNCNLK